MDENGIVQKEQRTDTEMIRYLEDRLKKAIKYLYEGKQRFAPETANSLVDELLNERELRILAELPIVDIL